jgi:hypothetical protein
MMFLGRKNRDQNNDGKIQIKSKRLLEIIISHNEEQNYVLLRKMGGTRDHYVN